MVSKHKKLILSIGLILLIISLGIFVFDVKQAQAVDFWGTVAKGFLIGYGYLALGFLWVSGQLLNLIAGLVNGVLSYNEFTKAAPVKLGWSIVRDLTNMFFVLILLIIAFATILRIESYGMKQLLPRLIIAALLINFSLVLAGPIIDFSQILTQFFVDEIEKNATSDFATQMAISLNLSKIAPDLRRCVKYDEFKDTSPQLESIGKTMASLHQECLYEAGRKPQADVYPARKNCDELYKKCTSWASAGTNFEWGKSLGDTISIIMGLTMANIFSLIAIFVFSAFVAFLIVRILALWFLLIIAPAAWLFSILPNTSHLFKDWWSAFLKWCFFAPIYMFFVYIALVSFRGLLTGTAVADSITNQEPSQFLPALFEWSNMLSFILSIGMLIGGLIVAQKMSIHGASGAIAIGKGFTKGAGKLAGRWGGRLGMRAALKVAPSPQKTTEGKIKGGWAQRGLAQFAKIKGLGKLATPVFSGLEKARAAIEKPKTATKGWTSQHRVDTFNRANAETKVAHMQALYEAKDLNMLSSKQRETGLGLAQRYGQEGKLIQAMPSFAKKIGKSVQEVVNKITSENLTRMVPGQLDIKEIETAVVEAFHSGQMTSSHLIKIANESPDLRVKFQQKIITKENVKKFAPPVKEYLKSYLGNSLYETPPEWLEDEDEDEDEDKTKDYSI